MTTSQLKQERLHAEDLAEQVVHQLFGEAKLPADFGIGVNLSVTWPLGEIVVLSL